MRDLDKYLPEMAQDFELVAKRLVTLAGRLDRRIGIEGTTRKTGGRKSKN